MLTLIADALFYNKEIATHARAWPHVTKKKKKLYVHLDVEEYSCGKFILLQPPSRPVHVHAQFTLCIKDDWNILY